MDYGFFLRNNDKDTDARNYYSQHDYANNSVGNLAGNFDDSHTFQFLNDLPLMALITVVYSENEDL